MEKDYFAVWMVRGVPSTVNGSVCRIAVPPHSEPKGRVLDEIIIEDIYAKTPQLDSPDVIDIYSVVELPNPLWPCGRTMEVSLGGRPVQLESGHAGWRLHV